MAQHGKLVSQDSGRSSFYPLHDPGRGLLRPALQKEVNAVAAALHRKDFDIEFLARLLCEFPETVFHMRDVENLAPIPRTKDKMILDEGDGGSRPEILIHGSIILQYICLSNGQTQKGGARLTRDSNHGLAPRRYIYVKCQDRSSSLDASGFATKILRKCCGTH